MQEGRVGNASATRRADRRETESAAKENERRSKKHRASAEMDLDSGARDANLLLPCYLFSQLILI